MICWIADGTTVRALLLRGAAEAERHSSALRTRQARNCFIDFLFYSTIPERCRKMHRCCPSLVREDFLSQRVRRAKFPNINTTTVVLGLLCLQPEVRYRYLSGTGIYVEFENQIFEWRNVRVYDRLFLFNKSLPLGLDLASDFVHEPPVLGKKQGLIERNPDVDMGILAGFTDQNIEVILATRIIVLYP